MAYIDLTQSLLVLIFISLILIVKFYLSKRKMYSIAEKIPGPKGYPVIGNSLDFLEDSTEKILHKVLYYFQTNPRVFKFWIGPKLIIGVSEPEDLEVILNHKECLAKDSLYDITKALMGNGIFSAPVATWKKNRKLMNPLFNQKFLELFVAVFDKNAKILLDVLEKNIENKEMDIFEKFNNCTISCMSEAVMGIELNAHSVSDNFGNWLDRAMPILVIRMSNVLYRNDFIFRWTTYRKVLDEILHKVHTYTMNLIKKQMHSFKQKLDLQDENRADDIGPKIQKKTFLDSLLQLSIEEGKLTEEEMRDEITTLIVGGTESTTNVMSFCSLLLGMHPEVQEKVYEEIIDVIGKDREVKAEDLPRFQYLEKCIKESMRLFPLGPLLLRSSTANIDLGDFVIPEGSTILISPIHTQRNPKYWKNPLKFDPDRFSLEETAKRHPYSYLPFSAGPRACIGLRLAMINMKTILSEVVRKFVLKTRYTSIEEIDLKVVLSLRPVHGYKVWIEPRTREEF